MRRTITAYWPIARFWRPVLRAHLEWLTARLNRQFTELTDNHEFLGAEIFEGAGKDMIRQNALNLSEDFPFLDNCPKKK